MTTIDEEMAAFAEWFNRLLSNVERVIKGKTDQVALSLVCLFAEGHLLLEDVPGTGKTVLAKSIANSIDGKWSRIQFTPDMLPSDVTGAMVPDENNVFKFRKGAVFANIVLADEINRASPKTQAALLEVMEERQVTIDGTAYDVPRPFGVIATQNPVEQEGTYRLPEAQLDRFLMKTSLGPPDHDAEVEVLRSAASGVSPDALDSVLTTKNVMGMVELVNQVHVADPVHSYIVRICDASRQLDDCRLGVSTRGAIALMRTSRSLAASQGRSFVTADDVKTVAPPVMEHRLLLSPDAELRGVKTSQLVSQLLDSVEAPAPVRQEA